MSLHIVQRCALGAALMALADPALSAAARTPALPPISPTVACPNPPTRPLSLRPDSVCMLPVGGAPRAPIQVVLLQDTSSR